MFDWALSLKSSLLIRITETSSFAAGVARLVLVGVIVVSTPLEIGVGEIGY